ncbi:MAG TPA: hypothetical protein VGO47_01160, partial [Chlamydiales bacterium]|nr:hypothetical protein [Chlamydiales bacterium]
MSIRSVYMFTGNKMLHQGKDIPDGLSKKDHNEQHIERAREVWEGLVVEHGSRRKLKAIIED